MNDPERKELRRSFLLAIDELADGNPAHFVYWRDVAPSWGWILRTLSTRNGGLRWPSTHKGLALSPSR